MRPFFHAWPAISVPNSPRYCLRRLQRSCTIHHIPPKPAGRYVVPTEEQAFATVREANLKAPAPWDGLVFEDADAVGHAILGRSDRLLVSALVAQRFRPN